MLFVLAKTPGLFPCVFLVYEDVSREKGTEEAEECFL